MIEICLQAITAILIGTALALVVNAVRRGRHDRAKLLDRATVHLVVGNERGTIMYENVPYKSLDYSSSPWVSFVTQNGLHVEAACPYIVIREEREVPE